MLELWRILTEKVGGTGLLCGISKGSDQSAGVGMHEFFGLAQPVGVFYCRDPAIILSAQCISCVGLGLPTISLALACVPVNEKLKGVRCLQG